jgi:hypothetical protein
MESLGFIHGNKLWRSKDRQRYYTWDSLHGEIEVFNSRGRHLGALDAVSGREIKEIDKRKTIRVS